MQRMLLDGLTYMEIARRFGVSRQRVQQIVSPPKYIVQVVSRRAKGRCENCGIIIRTGGQLHHVNNDDANLDNVDDVGNIEYLCLSCHRMRHYLKGGGWREGQKSISLDITSEQVRELKVIAAEKHTTVKALVNAIIKRELLSTGELK